MKLTLQLVVVVLIAPTNFRDNLQQFVQIYFIYNNNIQGRRHEMSFLLTCSHSTQLFFHEIRTPTENKHARIVEIG